MKITKRQLRRIIREEYSQVRRSSRRRTLREGVWAVGTPQETDALISKLEAIKEEAYNVAGDDEFMDLIDEAINRVVDLARGNTGY